jgi:hypothetical protein
MTVETQRPSGRPKLPPRLYLRMRGGNTEWVIREGQRELATGFKAGEVERAEVQTIGKPTATRKDGPPCQCAPADVGFQ